MMPSEIEPDPLQRLVDSFRAQLDEALIRAIATDHDLDTTSGYHLAHQTLQDLAQHSAVEEFAIFCPNDDGSQHDEPPHAYQDSRSTSGTSLSHQPSLAQHTDSSHTDQSSGDSSGSGAGNAYSIPRLTSFINDSEETKILHLRDMFAELKEIDIKTALRKANGDFQTALDELLKVQYLESTGQRQRGVDGFFTPDEDDDQTGNRKGKGKRKNRKNKRNSQATLPNLTTPIHDPQPHHHHHSSEKHLKHQDEIAYLADRIDISYDQVSAIYYNKKCSSGAAAAEILEQFIALDIRAHDDESKGRATELAARYRIIPEHYLLTLVQVTGSIAQFADDVAALLSRHFAKNPWRERLDLTHRLTPLPNEELEGGVASLTVGGARSQISGTKSPWKAVPSTSIWTAPTGNTSRDTFRTVQQQIQETQQAKRDAESHATHLARRGAGNSLYKQAAHVYRERAHDHHAQEHQLTSAAADLHVDERSTSSSCDLHGVYVNDGVRIAKRKVWAWWRGLGEFPVKMARERPYTVITGLGRHSAGGVSKLRQHVAVALLQEGWRIQVETGRFVVYGRR